MPSSRPRPVRNRLECIVPVEVDKQLRDATAAYGSSAMQEFETYLGLARIVLDRVEGFPSVTLVIRDGEDITLVEGPDVQSSMRRRPVPTASLGIDLSSGGSSTLRTLTRRARPYTDSEAAAQNLAVSWCIEFGSATARAVRTGGATAFLSRDGALEPGVRLDGQEWTEAPVLDERIAALVDPVTDHQRASAQDALDERYAADPTMDFTDLVATSQAIDTARTVADLEKALARPADATTAAASDVTSTPVAGQRAAPAADHHRARPAHGPRAHGHR